MANQSTEDFINVIRTPDGVAVSKSQSVTPQEPDPFYQAWSKAKAAQAQRNTKNTNGGANNQPAVILPPPEIPIDPQESALTAAVPDESADKSSRYGLDTETGYSLGIQPTPTALTDNAAQATSNAANQTNAAAPVSSAPAQPQQPSSGSDTGNGGALFGAATGGGVLGSLATKYGPELLKSGTGIKALPGALGLIGATAVALAGSGYAGDSIAQNYKESHNISDADWQNRALDKANLTFMPAGAKGNGNIAIDPNGNPQWLPNGMPNPEYKARDANGNAIQPTYVTPEQYKQIQQTKTALANAQQQLTNQKTGNSNQSGKQTELTKAGNSPEAIEKQQDPLVTDLYGIKDAIAKRSNNWTPEARFQPTVSVGQIQSHQQILNERLIEAKETLGRGMSAVGGSGGVLNIAKHVLQDTDIPTMAKEIVDKLGIKEEEDSATAVNRLSEAIYNISQTQGGMPPALAAEAIMYSITTTTGLHDLRNWIRNDSNISDNNTIIDAKVTNILHEITKLKGGPLNQAVNDAMGLITAQNTYNQALQQINQLQAQSDRYHEWLYNVDKQIKAGADPKHYGFDSLADWYTHTYDKGADIYVNAVDQFAGQMQKILQDYNTK